MKAGAEHLSDKLEHIKLDQTNIVLTEDTVAEVLEQAEAKLVKTMETIGMQEEGFKDASAEGTLGRTLSGLRHEVCREGHSILTCIDVDNI